jgi:hypothetical protein
MRRAGDHIPGSKIPPTAFDSLSTLSVIGVARIPALPRDWDVCE